MVKIVSTAKCIVYNITEDEFIEYEQCAERLKSGGIRPGMVEMLALHCHLCPLARPCTVVRESAFLGAKTC
jgi:hypothetical protein